MRNHRITVALASAAFMATLFAPGLASASTAPGLQTPSGDLPASGPVYESPTCTDTGLPGTVDRPECPNLTDGHGHVTAPKL